jgi:tRNA wybutosine-synthesizing protein 2
MAVHSAPDRIFACELNPTAHHYLCDNIELNNIQTIVTPVLGDNRDFDKEDIADRIVMGYLENTYMFLPKALAILKREGGIIHYHEKCPNDILPDRPVANVKREAVKQDRSMEILKIRTVKSYAPGVSHVVLDVGIGNVQ